MLQRRSTDASVGTTPDDTLAALCEIQRRRTPDAVALVCGHDSFSFETLHARADALAQHLAALGAGRDTIVGIALPRTADLIVAVLAIHKAGAAYLPLDPAYPAERIAYIVADSGAPIILTTSSFAPSFAHAPAQLILLDDLQDTTGSSRVSPPSGDSLSYVLYTSGSTGRPKAVGVEHHSVVNLVRWARSLIDETDLDGVLFATSLNFDISVFEIFVPLAFGGRIIMAENLLSAGTQPNVHQVRLVNTSPTPFDALLRTGRLPVNTRTVILAGEVLSRELADRLFAARPTIQLFNLYGPTETTVFSTGTKVRAQDTDPPTIGQAAWNTTLYILDPQQQPVPPGGTGELYIGGAGVARGYLNRPDLTRERFIPNPFGPGRLYRTGDLVSRRADSLLVYRGRCDRQLKINGIRIEPEEIEAAILALPGVAAAVVELHSDSSDIKRLTAYLVAGTAPLSTDDIAKRLGERLPSHMVPARYVWLDAFPITPNGKIDRAALPALAASPLQALPPLHTALEFELAAIWQAILQCGPIRLDHEFYALGGDSLAAISLFVEVEKQFGVQLAPDILSDGLTISRLANRILSQKESPSSVLVPLQPLGSGNPFYCVHSLSGDILHLSRLAEAMGTDRPFIGLLGSQNRMAAGIAIEDMAKHYVDAILADQQQGPFLLGGFSFGASIAYEMACQLTARGHAVGLVALIDHGPATSRFAMDQVIPSLATLLRHGPIWLWEEMRRHGLVSVVRAQAQALTRRLSRRRGGQFQDAAEFEALARHFPPERAQTVKSNYQAMLAYRPGKYPGSVNVFRMRATHISHLFGDYALGWTGKALGGAHVCLLPGDHGSILKEPDVQALADALRAALASAGHTEPHADARAVPLNCAEASAV